MARNSHKYPTSDAPWDSRWLIDRFSAPLGASVVITISNVSDRSPSENLRSSSSVNSDARVGFSERIPIGQFIAPQLRDRW